MNAVKSLFGALGAVITYIQNHFRAMLFLLLVVVIFAPSGEESGGSANLQSLELTGTILDTTELVRAIDKAAKNKQIEGVMLVVDSPGGAVPPSLEVAYALKRLKAKKPVVVYAKGVLASGSYYASIWASEIVANPGAMVGSIGVILQGFNVEELLKKVGVATQIAKAGKFKQAGTPERLWTEYERAELEKVINATYTMFVADVAEARGLDAAMHTRFADAHIFTAAQARQIGLIDAVGVEYDARKRLEALSGVAEPAWKEPSRIDKFFHQMGAETSAWLYRYFPSVSLR